MLIQGDASANDLRQPVRGEDYDYGIGGGQRRWYFKTLPAASPVDCMVICFSGETSRFRAFSVFTETRQPIRYVHEIQLTFDSKEIGNGIHDHDHRQR